MKIVIMIIGLVSLLFWGGVRIYDGVMFDIHCGDYLKRAADSNSIELATENLERVVAYAKTMGLTHGNTGVLWQKPEWDVGFWYQNVAASLAELHHISNDKNATNLERSNVLMKLEKTMLDQGSDFPSVVVPDGISIFPANSVFFFWLWLSIIVFAVPSGIIFIKDMRMM